MELWDVYDVNRAKTGKTIRRGDFTRVLLEGEYHLIVHVCIFNSNGEMLIQKRQAGKRGWPGYWDLSAGGSAVSGEMSQAAAARETREEIGYSVDLGAARPHLTLNFEHGFDDIYLLEADLDVKSLVLQAEEVSRVAWASREDILRMIREGLFVPYHVSLIALLFDIRSRRSGISV